MAIFIFETKGCCALTRQLLLPPKYVTFSNTQLNIYAFQCQHLYGTLFESIWDKFVLYLQPIQHHKLKRLIETNLVNKISIKQLKMHHIQCPICIFCADKVKFNVLFGWGFRMQKEKFYGVLSRHQKSQCIQWYQNYLI